MHEEPLAQVIVLLRNMKACLESKAQLAESIEFDDFGQSMQLVLVGGRLYDLGGVPHLVGRVATEAQAQPER